MLGSYLRISQDGFNRGSVIIFILSIPPYSISLLMAVDEKLELD